MWTKEDLQGKYIKITSQQDYDTVIKVLEELGIQQYTSYKNETYQSRFNSVFITIEFCYFLSESKYSDIPIQQFYDYLSSKTLKIEDLVESEIYKYFYDKCYLIAKCSESKTLRVSNYIQIHDDNENNNLSGRNNCVASKSVQLASTEEKKHFQVCIKQNKFIPKEDLHLYDDVTFELKSQTIPEYVECVTSKSDWTGKFTVGKIYKKDNYATTAVIALKSDDNKSYTVTYLGTTLSFKPSTKEAFEAQNKLKFEVGKWYKTLNTASGTYYVKNKFENNGLDSFREYIKSNKHYCNNVNLGLEGTYKYELLTDLSEIQKYLPAGHPDKIKPMEKSLVGRYLKALVDFPNSTPYKKGDYIQIRTDNLKGSVTCKKAFLFGWGSYNWEKSNVELMPEGFVPSKESEEWIPQVGEFYTLIDSEKNNPKWDSFKGILEVEKFDGEYVYPKNKDGIHQNVKLFRKCLPHEIPNTTQEVKEMSKEELLEEAKRRYPVGTKFYTSKTGVLRTIKDEPFLFSSLPLIICCKTKENSFNAEIYTNDKWAEIVELPKSKTIDLTNTKIRVDTPELSKLVQEKAFELGWKWRSGGKTIQLTNSKFLFFSESFISKSDEDEKYFIQHSSKEILPSDLGINLNITKIIPKLEIKFDYDTYLFKEGFTKYPLTSNEAFKIDNNQVNLLVKQNESVTLKRTENEVNIKVNNLKTIKI